MCRTNTRHATNVGRIEATRVSAGNNSYCKLDYTMALGKLRYDLGDFVGPRMTTSQQHNPNEKEAIMNALITSKSSGKDYFKSLNCRLTAGLLVVATFFLVGGCQSTKDSGSSPSSATAVSPPTKAVQAAMTPELALAELKDGNARFVSGHPLARNPQADV